MPVQPRTPPGVLELLPAKQLAHQRMIDTIRRGYERFGFLPIETPVFEVADVLLTKSGGETEKQVYFVQSTGALEAGKRPELALRFDLTVPLARYVAEHENELNFPFRRYQIQRVYRGERAQKGRFREFYQCDIDVIARDTLSFAYDAEVPAVIYGVFAELLGPRVPFTIHINNRKLLRGILESVGIPAEQHGVALGELDRLGKLEPPEVLGRLVAAGIGPAQQLLDVVTADAADSRALLARLAAMPEATPALREGLTELTRVYEGTLALGVPARALRVDLRIARGLDYYTGTVYETFLDDHRGIGSVCSGGRYENLAGHYSKSKLPGVGISIGLTRLFWQLDELGLLDATRATLVHALVLNDAPELAADYATIARELRDAGLNVEVYGSDDKLGKQFKYADRAKVPVTILFGTRERDAATVKLKDLRANAEHVVPRAELVARVRALVA